MQIFLLSLLGMFCLIGAIIYYMHRKKQVLKDFAHRMGWGYSGDNLYSLPTIGGNYRGHAIEIFIDYRESEQSFGDETRRAGQHYSVIRLPFADPVSLHLKITPTGFLTSPGIVFSDETFIKTYSITGSDE